MNRNEIIGNFGKYYKAYKNSVKNKKLECIVFYCNKLRELVELFALKYSKSSVCAVEYLMKSIGVW